MNETLHMDPSTGDPGTPPPPVGVPWYRVPIARDATNDKLGGVVAGVSRAYGFDVKTTRIAVALCALVIPFVLFAYIVAWVLLPADPAPARSLEDVVRDRRRRPLYVAVAIIGVIIAFGSLGTWWIAGGVGWGVGLVVVGVLLWVASSSRRASEWPAPLSTPKSTPMSTDVPVSDVPAATTAMPLVDVTPSSAGAPLAPAPRRRRIPIASITTDATFIVCGILAAGDTLGWWNVSILGVIVVGGIVITAGLATSAIVNRAWWLAPIASIVAIGTTALLITQPNLDHGFGSRTVEITTPTTSVTERLSVGELVIDLRDAPVADDATLSVVAEVGIGNLRIVVPDDAVLVVEAHLGAGNVRIDGNDVLSGVRSESTVRRGTPGSGPEIDLDATMGLGQIEVVRTPTTP